MTRRSRLDSAQRIHGQMELPAASVAPTEDRRGLQTLVDLAESQHVDVQTPITNHHGEDFTA